MLTTLVIGNTGYARGGLAYAGFAGAGGTKAWSDASIFAVKLEVSDEAYSTLSFSVLGCGPILPFPPGLQVQVVKSADDGSSPVIWFTGDLQKPAMRASEQGPAWGYYCTDLKRRGDYASILSSNGSAVASYNLSPGDPLYIFSLAGQTVGQILTDLLQSATNASTLNGLGIGNYTIVSGVYTLPSATVADLAACAIVPPLPVQISGESFFNNVEGFLSQWQWDKTLYIQPDGTIRIISIFGRTAHTFTLPSDLTPGDPVGDLAYDLDIEGCFGAVQITGQDISAALLSYVDGTLVHSGAAPSSPIWTLADFNSPNVDNAANDVGTASGVTSTTIVVHSDNPTVHWPANYWNSNGGTIVLDDPAGTGIDITVIRQITACTAMVPGGTATITWDSGLPLSSSGYTRYRMFAMNTTRSLWDREFLVKDRASGLTGLSTYIGSHLAPYLPFAAPWGNLGRDAVSVSFVNYPVAKILWSRTGAWPWFESPINVEIDPRKGGIILGQPGVLTSAGFAGTVPSLYKGYPTNYFNGLWYDIQVLVPYNRGAISTRYPSSGFAGTAYTKYGRNLVKTIPLPNYIYKGDTPALNALAAQHHAVVKDAVIQGTLTLHYDSWTPTFDPIVPGYAIRVATPGAASDIDGIDLPVRSTLMEWDVDADIHRVTFSFNTRHRQFEGDALYTHPMYAPEGWGTQGDQMFVAGLQGGMMSLDYQQSEGADLDQGPGLEPMAEMGGGEPGEQGPLGMMDDFNSGHQGRLAKEQARQEGVLANRKKAKETPIDPDAPSAASASVPSPGPLRRARGIDDEPSPPPTVSTPPSEPAPTTPPPRQASLREKRYDDQQGGG